MNFHSSHTPPSPTLPWRIKYRSAFTWLYLLGLWPARGQYFVCALRRINVKHRFFALLLFLLLLLRGWCFLLFILSAFYVLESLSPFSFSLCAHKSYGFRNVSLVFSCHYYCCNIALSTLDIFIPNSCRYRTTLVNMLPHTGLTSLNATLFRTLFSMHKDISWKNTW